MLPVHVEPLPGRLHRIEFVPALDMPRSEERAADVAEGTRRINAALGQLIRRRPELWLWTHRRWRGSPDLEADPYPRRR